MRDWAIDYILHVLEKMDWSANRLATEAGVASTTISRPLRERDNYAGRLSRSTIEKIRAVTGIDPGPFIPREMAEDADHFASPSPARSRADRLIARLDGEDAKPARNEIKIAVVGDLAQIVATVDLEGIEKLRRKIDAIEEMLRT